MKNEVKRGKKEKGEKEQAKKMQKKVQYIYFFMFMQYNFKNAQKKNRLLQRAIPVYSLSIFSRLPWGTTGGLSFVDDDRLLLATDGVVNHDPIPVFLIHMAVQRIADPSEI